MFEVATPGCLYLVRPGDEGEGYAGINTRNLLRTIDPQSFPCLSHPGDPLLLLSLYPLSLSSLIDMHIFDWLTGWRAHLSSLILRSSTFGVAFSVRIPPMGPFTCTVVAYSLFPYIHSCSLPWQPLAAKRRSRTRTAPTSPSLPHREGDHETGSRDSTHTWLGFRLVLPRSLLIRPCPPQEICNTFCLSGLSP